MRGALGGREDKIGEDKNIPRETFDALYVKRMHAVSCYEKDVPQRGENEKATVFGVRSMERKELWEEETEEEQKIQGKRWESKREEDKRLKKAKQKKKKKKKKKKSRNFFRDFYFITNVIMCECACVE